MRKTKATAKAEPKPTAKTKSAATAKKAVAAKRAGVKVAAAAATAGGPGARSPAPRQKRSAPAVKKRKPAKPERRAAPRAPATSAVAAAPTADSSAEGCYVYCIIRSSTPLRFGAIGLGAQPSEVRTINYRDLAAVVSDTPLEVYDPTRENVLAHERVNDSVMREHTVLPMSFGTVFKTSSS